MSARRRLLFVGPAIRFMNPTSSLLVDVLAGVGDVVCFGPGYCDEPTLAAGLERFVDCHGPFDAAVTTEVVGISFRCNLNVEHVARVIGRLYTFDFPLDHVRFMPGIRKAFCRLAVPRFMSLLMDDLYAWGEPQLAAADETAHVFLSNGPENSVRVADMRHREDEPWSLRATDGFVDFVAREPHRFASFPLFVGPHEFCRSAHRLRRRDWAVPGVQYRARKIAAEKLRSRGHRFTRVAPSRWTGRLATTVGRMPELGILLSNHLFRRELETSRAVFTCGSVLRQPIRKFFEIPAAGALLACEPCAGFADYGFVDGLNCRIVPAEDVLDVEAEIRGDPQRVETIAQAGADLVLREHTTSARVRQLTEIIDRVLEGTFAGGRWNAGSYRVARAAAPVPA